MANLSDLIGSLFGRPQSNTRIGKNKYALNAIVSTVPFWGDVQDVWKLMGSSNQGASTVYGGPINTDAAEQISQLETLLESGVNGFVISPAHSTNLVSIINAISDRGIPVVTLLTDAPHSKRLCYVTSEIHATSVRVAKQAMECTPSRARGENKAIIMYAGAGNHEQEGRAIGFKSIADEFDLELVKTIEDEYSVEIGMNRLSETLKNVPDVKFVFGCNSQSAVSAIKALRNLNYAPGELTITGWDTDSDVLHLITEGWIAATAAQNTTYMLQIAFQILQAFHGGYLLPPARRFRESGVSAVPSELYVPATIVTAQNVEAYLTEHNRLSIPMTQRGKT